MTSCKPRTLYIDLETYSSVDISKAGAFKYVESPDFEIILLAYAWGDDPVRVIATQSDSLVGLWTSDPDAEQELQDVAAGLFDPDTVKVAHNSAFERAALSQVLGQELPAEEWQDTMITAAMNGLPMSLDAAGAALQLTSQKIKEGTLLINYFCKPCKPTISNGGRTRNRPEHAPDKWERFAEYCRRDVEVCRTIHKRLAAYPVTELERQVWALDARINERGVQIDRELVGACIKVDEELRAKYKAEMQQLTGLDNPNSVQQLQGWLEIRGVSCESLNKETVSELLGKVKRQDVRRVLELRQLLSKTSVKKYEAMQAAACGDDRVRGLLQYYGAGRTGRWCLTGDHEVLTPSGWVRLDCWRGGKIMCWNHQSETLAFQKAEAVSFPYNGEMVAYTSQRCAQVATPDHKMAVLSNRGEWEARTVDEIGAKRVTIPFTGTGHHRSSPDTDQLRVLLMTQADGHYTDTGAVRYHFAKRRKIERCKRLLRRCGLPFIEKFYGEQQERAVLQVPAKCVPLWLRQFEHKTLDYWLLNEPPEVVFDELAEWDGYRCGPNSLQYVSTCEKNVDVLQACALLAGYSATKLVKRRGNPKWSDAYVLNVWLTPGRGTTLRAEQIKRTTHEGAVYCAVTPTGYFAVRREGVVWITGNSGRQVQVQNLPQNHLDHLGAVREIVRGGDLDALEMLFPSVPDVLSQLTRTALVAKPGHTFLVCDYSAIEARVIAYLAGEKWRLDVFAGDGKIYEASYAQAFGVPKESVKKGSPERQKGKIMELALGYQGGVGALKAFGADKMGLSEQEMEDLVTKWRLASPSIPKFWKAAETAVKHALLNPGKVFALPCGVRYRRDRDALRCKLPSGRLLSYWGARMGPDGRLYFLGQNQTTRKWEEMETWGGRLVENIVQAYARDCLAVALVRLDQAGYRITFHVHDEIVAEAPEGSGWEDMAEIMGRPIDWAPGLLLRAEGYDTQFYRKD